MDLDSVLEDVLRSSGQGNLTLKPRQKEALQSIVFKGQAPVVQTLDSAIHRINHYPADKY